MRLVKALYHDFELLIHELAKFGVIGMIGFVVTYGGSNLLHVGIGLGPLTSNVIATVVAITIAYIGNRYWTFRHRENSGLGREYFLFFMLNGVGLLIQLLCIGFVHYTLDKHDSISYNVALFVGIGLGTIFRFWSYKRWVFLPPQAPAVDPHTGLPSREDIAAPDSPKALGLRQRLRDHSGPRARR